MTSAKQIASSIIFKENLPPGVIAYEIKHKKILYLVYLNGTNIEQTISVGKGVWYGKMPTSVWTPTDRPPVIKSTTAAPYSCTVLYLTGMNESMFE